MPDLINESDDDVPTTTSYIKQISKLLCSVKITGDFATGLDKTFFSDFTGGKVDSSVLPGLNVNGIGAIGLPLVSSQMQEMIKLCEQAPYGKGEDTIVDTSVRNTWQLSPTQFQITNPK